jgi:predicted nucleic acid-binding protein
MIVVDASAMTELLLQTPLGVKVEARLFRDGDMLCVPHLLDVEVAQAVRRLARAGEVTDARAAATLVDLADFDLDRHAHVDLLDRIWQLRTNLTAYDAVYVALAEALEAPLVTCDAPLSKAPGHKAEIEVIQ